MTAIKATLKEGSTSIYPQTTEDMVFIEGDANNRTLRQYMSETDTEISQLGQEVDELADAVGITKITLTVEQGAIASATGLDTESTTRIRTSGYIEAEQLSVRTNGSRVYAMGYAEDGTYISSDGWHDSDFVAAIEGAKKYRFVFAKSDDSDISPEDFSSLLVSIWKRDDIPFVARPSTISMSVTDDNIDTITLDEIVLFSKSGAHTYYVDGNESSHLEKTFIFSNTSSNGLYLVLASDGTIVQRRNASFLVAGDIILLSYNPNTARNRFFDGGILLPSVNNILYGNKILSTITCPDLTFDGDRTITIDTLNVYSEKGLEVIYANGDYSSHSPVTYEFSDTGSNLLLVLNKFNSIALSSQIREGDRLLLCKYSDGSFYGGVLFPQLSEIGINNRVNDDEIATYNKFNSTDLKIGDVDIEEIDLSQYTQGKGAIQSTGRWIIPTASTTKQRSLIIPINPEQSYSVKCITSFAIIALLTDSTYPTTNGAASFCSGYDSRITLSMNQIYAFTAPSDAGGLYVLIKNTAGDDCSPVVVIGQGLETSKQDKLISGDNIKTINGQNILGSGNIDIEAPLGNSMENVPVSLDSNGWEIPVSAGMVNTLKRAAQAAQIQYTTLAPTPGRAGASDVAAGTKTGINYSSVKEKRKFIGWEVSQKTFMTAVHNVYSMYYTENVFGEASASGYGFTYYGVNCGTYYGMVCSIFALWALGFDMPWDTFELAWLHSKGSLYKVNEQSVQGVHICDLIWRSGHCILVTAVQRDQYGNVINVQVTEALGKVRTVNYTAEEFETYLHTTYSCIIYRYPKIYESAYEKSLFIGVRGESTPSAYVYNDDICHYAGDYAAMRTNEPTWMNYTLGTYTGMKIYKEETLLETISLGDSSIHKVDISSYMTGAGKYSAVLTDGTNDSEPTHWELIDASMTYADGGETQRITFSQEEPWWVQVCSLTGVAYCWYQVTAADIARGYVDIDLASLIAEQYGSYRGDIYIRTMYKGDYGSVVSEMQQITLS